MTYGIIHQFTGPVKSIICPSSAPSAWFPSTTLRREASR